MLTSFRISIGLLAAVATSAAASAPFGEAVDCKIVNGQVALYSGTASCRVESYRPPYVGGVISAYIAVSQQPQHYISGYIAGNLSSCWADVPFSHYETVTRQECKYKPVADFFENPISNAVQIRSASRDYDGSIVSYQWRVDGEWYSDSSMIHLPYLSGRTGTYLVQLTVTDNDGYSHSSTRRVLGVRDFGYE